MTSSCQPAAPSCMHLLPSLQEPLTFLQDPSAVTCYLPAGPFCRTLLQLPVAFLQVLVAFLQVLVAFLQEPCPQDPPAGPSCRKQN